MNGDFLIVDNILHDPHALVELSKKISYYCNDNEKAFNIPLRLDAAKPSGTWRGYRSQFLNEINQKFIDNVVFEIIQKMYRPKKVHYEYKSFLNFMTKYTKDDESCWHIDEECCLAGILYLNENAPKQAGTLLKLDGKKLLIENNFNRFALYRANIFHKPSQSFGDSIDNSRLTLTLFFRRLNIEY